MTDDGRQSPRGSNPDIQPQVALPDADDVVAVLTELGVDFVRHDRQDFIVTLPGERRHKTVVWLRLGSRDLSFESFFCRAPDENAAGVYGLLLRRNAQLRAVAYAVDADGDIYLMGRLGRALITVSDMDRVIGTVLAASDADFNAVLERGFATAIRREWAWREASGQSLRNLAAFRRLMG